MLSNAITDELPPFSTASRRHLTIDSRFNGPDDMGNGGYVSGALAEVLGGPADIVLRAPAPLGRKLALVADGGAVELKDGATLVARVAAGTTDVEPPVRPTVADALKAEAAFEGHHTHPFPRCFVCGTARAEGDGLRIFTGRLGDKRGVVAGLWTPTPSMGDAGGHTFSRFVWGALDCPGAWGVFDGFGSTVAVLGKITGEQLAPIAVGEPHVVVGWGIAREGRKLFAGSAVLGQGGTLLARAEATWIELKDAARTT